MGRVLVYNFLDDIKSNVISSPKKAAENAKFDPHIMETFLTVLKENQEKKVQNLAQNIKKFTICIVLRIWLYHTFRPLCNFKFGTIRPLCMVILSCPFTFCLMYLYFFESTHLLSCDRKLLLKYKKNENADCAQWSPAPWVHAWEKNCIMNGKNFILARNSN